VKGENREYLLRRYIMASGSKWINSEPLSIGELKGKVVLIDFWTYSCINCIRTIPHQNTWHLKYADQGLVIIGIHSPEFAFEKDLSSLKEAVERYEIEYPIVQDNGFMTWNAYNNRYWPSKYLIDKKGVVRYRRIGEGGYNETEVWINRLLKEV
jgi:thiol-disulfide isomerase/thioredoxin